MEVFKGWRCILPAVPSFALTIWGQLLVGVTQPTLLSRKQMVLGSSHLQLEGGLHHSVARPHRRA